MIYTLIFKDLAIKDAGEIYIWYEDKGEKLSDQFIDELESCIEKIRLHPMAFQRKSGN